MAGVFLAGCGLLTTWWPVRRAAGTDVVTVLKTE
jgi:ABC-type lipoprotein release transport system permease subunit